jgi:hypothetical protein
MGVFLSFFLLKPEENTWMFFPHLLKSEDNHMNAIFNLLKSEDNTWMFSFFLFIYVWRKLVDVFSCYLLMLEDNIRMFFLSIYLGLKTTYACFFFPFTKVWRQHMDVFPIYLSLKTTHVFFHLLKSEENTWVVFFFLLI